MSGTASSALGSEAAKDDANKRWNSSAGCSWGGWNGKWSVNGWGGINKGHVRSEDWKLSGNGSQTNEMGGHKSVTNGLYQTDSWNNTNKCMLQDSCINVLTVRNILLLSIIYRNIWMFTAVCHKWHCCDVKPSVTTCDGINTYAGDSLPFCHWPGSWI